MAPRRRSMDGNTREGSTQLPVDSALAPSETRSYHAHRRRSLFVRPDLAIGSMNLIMDNLVQQQERVALERQHTMSVRQQARQRLRTRHEERESSQDPNLTGSRLEPMSACCAPRVETCPRRRRRSHMKSRRAWQGKRCASAWASGRSSPAMVRCSATARARGASSLPQSSRRRYRTGRAGRM